MGPRLDRLGLPITYAGKVRRRRLRVTPVTFALVVVLLVGLLLAVAAFQGPVTPVDLVPGPASAVDFDHARRDGPLQLEHQGPAPGR